MTLEEYILAINQGVELEVRKKHGGLWIRSAQTRMCSLKDLISSFHKFEYRKKPAEPVKKKGFINLYQHRSDKNPTGGCVYDTHEEAASAMGAEHAIAIARIEWEEPA